MALVRCWDEGREQDRRPHHAAAVGWDIIKGTLAAGFPWSAAMLVAAAGAGVELLDPRMPVGCCWGFRCRTGIRVGGYMSFRWDVGHADPPPGQGALGAGWLLNLLLQQWVAPHQ